METFAEKLKKVMGELHISQVRLSRMTGIGKSSISQYLSGKNIPTKERQEHIAACLGLPAGYFDRVHICSATPPEKKDNGCIARLLPAEAARLMGVGYDFITQGLQDGVFPWGYAVRGTGGKWIYWINARAFAETERVKYEEI